MAAPMKSMWDRTTELWTNGSLVGKIGAVFTSAASVHGGQETTAVSMMFPMFHHSMILIGVPYSVEELTESGSPYGASTQFCKEYDKERYLEMLLDAAEAVLSVFGFSRSLFGFDKKSKHWWDELYQQRERDIESAKIEL